MIMFIFASFFTLFVLCILGTIQDIYTDEKRKDCFEIKFNQFKKFYAISPNKYKLCMYHVVKEGAPAHFIKFNLIDTFRYINFVKQTKKNKHNECMNNKMKEYLNSVQNDINDLNKKAQEEIERAKKEMER